MPDADDKIESDSSASPQTESISTEAAEQEEEQAPTPFDHPLFLPTLLTGLALWFGYDGWLTTDPNMLEHATFNRVVFVPLFLGAIYTGITGYKEWKEDRE